MEVGDRSLKHSGSQLESARKPSRNELNPAPKVTARNVAANKVAAINVAADKVTADKVTANKVAAEYGASRKAKSRRVVISAAVAGKTFFKKSVNRSSDSRPSA